MASAPQQLHKPPLMHAHVNMRMSMSIGTGMGTSRMHFHLREAPRLLCRGENGALELGGVLGGEEDCLL